MTSLRRMVITPDVGGWGLVRSALNINLSKVMAAASSTRDSTNASGRAVVGK